MTLIKVGNPTEQITKSGWASLDAADESLTPGMVDGDLWIQYEE